MVDQFLEMVFHFSLGRRDIGIGDREMNPLVHGKDLPTPFVLIALGQLDLSLVDASPDHAINEMQTENLLLYQFIVGRVHDRNVKMNISQHQLTKQVLVLRCCDDIAGQPSHVVQG